MTLYKVRQKQIHLQGHWQTIAICLWLIVGNLYKVGTRRTEISNTEMFFNNVRQCVMRNLIRTVLQSTVFRFRLSEAVWRLTVDAGFNTDKARKKLHITWKTTNYRDCYSFSTYTTTCWKHLKHAFIHAIFWANARMHKCTNSQHIIKFKRWRSGTLRQRFPLPPCSSM